MPDQAVLTATLGGQTAVAVITPIDDTQLAFQLAINGRVTDTDVAEFHSTADRDEAYATVVRDMTASGYAQED